MDQKNTKSRGIKKTLPGNVYQVKLLMLYMHRCVENKYEFTLNSEVESAGKLDDVVLEYKKCEEGIPTLRWVQAKHKKNESSKIGYNLLLNQNQGDFSVLKYFSTYRDIKKKFKEPDATKEYIIYTNIGFHKNAANILEEISRSDPLTDIPREFTKTSPKFYKLKLNEKDELYSVLKNTTESKALAKELAKSINKGHKIVLTGLIKTYHKWIIENLIDSATNTLKNDIEDTPFSRIFLGLVKDRNTKIRVSKNFYKNIDRSGPNLTEIAANDEEIADYLDNLVFAVNQPNEVQLGKLIDKEMGEKYNLLQGDIVAKVFFNEILNWLKSKDSDEHTRISSESLFKKIKAAIKYLMRANMDILFKEEMKAYSVEFKNKNDDLINFLNNGMKILNIQCSDSLLGSLEVYYNIKYIIKNTSSPYKAKDSKIYVDMDAMVSVPSVIRKIKEHFTRGVCNLLIVKCRSCDKEDIGLINDLLNVLKGTKSKKIILISTEPYDLSDLNITSLHVNSKCKFKEFALKTQNKLKKFCINFQGAHKPLRNLIEATYLADIPGKYLMPLIRNKNVEIGEKLNQVDGDLYILRQFNQKIEIEMGILKENTRIFETIIITANENTSDLVISNRAVKFIPDREWNENKFDNTDEPMHWLKLQDNKLIWHRSNCSIKHLIDFRTETTSPKFEDDLLNEKFCIISDIAGMGKSTVLTNIASKIKESNENRWVVIVDLNSSSCHSDLNQMIGKGMNTDIVKSFLMDTLLNFDNNPSLDRYLFKSILEGEKTGIQISLLIDGFDEICPTYENIVIQLLEELKELNITNIIVTTRPLLKEVLESRLGVFSYTLEPFPPEHQRRYLLNFFKSKIGRDINERMKIYVDCLINNISYSFKQKEMQFIGVPLHIYMVAEIFAKKTENNYEWETCEQFLASNSHDPVLPKSFGLIKLYDLFYDHKIAVFRFNKSRENFENLNMTDALNDKIDRLCEYQHKLSLKLFFNEQEIKNIDGETENLSNYMQNNLSKLGFVVNLGNDQKLPEFTHRTYAEYFVAKFFIHVLNKPNDIVKHILFTKVLLNNEFKVIRAFLNSNMPSNHSGITKDDSYLVLLWKKDPTLVCKNGRSILHVVAEEGNKKLVDFILNNLRGNEEIQKRVIQHEDEEGQTALHAAVKSGCLETVKSLLNFQENKDNIKQHKDNIGRSFLFIAAFHGHWDVVRWLLERRPSISSGDINVRRVFFYASISGVIDVMQWFLEKRIFDHIYMKCNGVLLDIIKYGQLKVMDFLLESNYYTIDSDDDYENLVYAAFEHGKQDIVTYLATVCGGKFDSTFKYVETECKQPSFLTKKRRT